MVLHGLSDSSLFLSISTGVEPSAAQYAIYPLAIVCVFVVLLKNRNPNDEPDTSNLSFHRAQRDKAAPGGFKHYAQENHTGAY